ncbi:hypothetical protein [Jeotgalibaca porci]|uniref:hypothetical protein n=1 Tax=Jeotgalibaca porci TaxID=1868793 RepID=UPI00359FF5F1
MRNKAKFIEDAYPVVKPEFTEALNVVEDAAHVMNQTGETTYTIPSQFTLSDKDESFKFEKQLRPSTEDLSHQVEDYFYIGRGE